MRRETDCILPLRARCVAKIHRNTDVWTNQVIRHGNSLTLDSCHPPRILLEQIASSKPHRVLDSSLGMKLYYVHSFNNHGFNTTHESLEYFLAVQGFGDLPDGQISEIGRAHV